MLYRKLFGGGASKREVLKAIMQGNIKELEALLKNTPSLNLMGCNIGDKKIQVLAEAFKKNCIYFGVKKLNLTKNNIGDKGIQVLAEVLKEDRGLEELNLMWNNISDEGAQFLAEAFKGKHFCFKKLNLLGNKISYKGAKVLVDNLEGSGISILLEKNLLKKEPAQKQIQKPKKRGKPNKRQQPDLKLDRFANAFDKKVPFKTFFNILDKQDQQDKVWYMKGDALFDQNKYDEAIECFDKALYINPKNDSAWHMKGYALFDQKKYDEAIECFDKALDINPQNDKAWYIKGYALYQQDKYDEAIKCFDKALDIKPKNDSAWYMKGYALYNQKKYNEAIKCLDKALDINPKKDKAWYMKVYALYNQKKYTKVLKCCNKAISLNPKKSYYDLRKVALELLKKQKNQSAQKSQQFQNLIKLRNTRKKQKNRIEQLNNQGLKFLEQNKYAEALDCFNKVLLMEPNNLVGLNHKGLVFYEQDKYDEAINCYNQVLNIDAENIFALHNKGNALYAQGKNQEAIQCFNKVLKKKPNDLDALNNKGLVLHDEEQYIEAIECYELGLKLNPQDSELLKNRDSARRALKKIQTQANKTILKASFIISYKDLTIDKKTQLGAGGFGVVYGGTWQGTKVAIKQLLIPKMTENGLKAFKQEATIMAKLHHPNVLQLYGFCVEPGRYCMVMKYMPNGSLYNLLHSTKQFTWPQRWQVAIGIGNGLLQLHSKNILHRDLTSHNVLLSKSLKPKICDFGLSAVKQETRTSIYSNQSNQSVGKIPWMAPELFKPNAKCTKACDMFSFGMLLWEMITRELPYKNAQVQGLIIQWVVAGTREKIPKKCPPSLAKLVKWCWEAEPKKRPAIEDAIKILQSNQHEALMVK